MLSCNDWQPPIVPGRLAAARRLAPLAWRVVFVRLRFLVVLVVAFVVVSQWDVVRNYWDAATRAAGGVNPVLQAVSADTEYFCPMDPGVVSDWPSKCPICNMTLVRRSRGDATPLPEGVIARMQFSPYRLALAGIRAAAVDYRALAREVEGPGRVMAGGREVQIEIFRGEVDGIEAGQGAEVIVEASEPLKATVRAVGTQEGEATVLVELNDPKARLPLRSGASVRGRVLMPIASVEPFRSMPSDPPKLKGGERRRVYECAEHPEFLSESPGRCPRDDQPLDRRDLAGNQRLRWWCPMHPDVTADVAGQKCEACGGMVLVAARRHLSPARRGAGRARVGRDRHGQAERSSTSSGCRACSTASRSVLGPRCGDVYPVVRGPGARPAGRDVGRVPGRRRDPAEPEPRRELLRRGSSAASPAAASDARPGNSGRRRALVALAEDLPGDGQAARARWGRRSSVDVAGRTVFLCCEGCEGAVAERARPSTSRSGRPTRSTDP